MFTVIYITELRCKPLIKQSKHHQLLANCTRCKGNLFERPRRHGERSYVSKTRLWSPRKWLSLRVKSARPKSETATGRMGVSANAEWWGKAPEWPERFREAINHSLGTSRPVPIRVPSRSQCWPPARQCLALGTRGFGPGRSWARLGEHFGRIPSYSRTILNPFASIMRSLGSLAPPFAPLPICRFAIKARRVFRPTKLPALGHFTI
jgi:hypothetical protein